jgi:hypothetical protein
MMISRSVTQKELFDVLLNDAVVRPVFIWGAPGIGKSSIVEQFAARLGLSCVSLLGSQLAPEDIIGVPQIINGKSVFCPPRSIAKDEPYCLFLDELNACSQEVQKAFYSLIHDKRIGEYNLPKGSIIIGAGNRAQDNAIVKPMSSALINRMFHIELKASHRDWLEWAANNGIHHLVLEYIGLRPDHLWSAPPKTEEPFSTPRSWHLISDILYSFGDNINEQQFEIIASGALTSSHAVQFRTYVKQIRNRYMLSKIISGEQKWPHDPQDRDTLFFLAKSFRAQLIKELPKNREKLSGESSKLAFCAKGLIKEIANISMEIAQMTIATIEEEKLPNWFKVEIIRDLPRLIQKEHK